MSESPLTPIAQQVCEKRYFQKDKDGNVIEDWKGLVTRVVNHVCSKENEKFKEDIFDLIYSTKFLPNSPCLVNAGNHISGLLACHTSPDVEDSWQSMAKNIETFGQVARRGGGNGICLSKIRPEGDPVFGSTHAKACGPIQHMIVVSEAMHSITQAGFRSMANMATLHINHPDVIKFIKCKQREQSLKHFLREDIYKHFDQMNGQTHNHLNIVLDKHIANFNISVFVSNKFMEAVEKDEDWNLEFGGKIYQTLKAKELFELIAENAWKNGDPGLLFDDTINNSPYKYSKQKITSTNPCFHPDTMVAVTDERKFVSIKQLAEIGADVEVYCCDPKTGETFKRWGRNPRKTRENAELIRLTFENKGSVITTPDHKVMLSHREYIEVKDIEIGSLVKTIEIKYANNSENAKEQLYLCEDLKVIDKEFLSKTSEVYNITVDDYHNLCIGTWTSVAQSNITSYLTVVYKNCGEQTLPNISCSETEDGFGRGGSCNLGSIDISKFYDKKENDLNWEEFKKAIQISFRFLDNVIDANKFPGPAFELWAKENRPVGLGLMGWADLLLKMRITYGSKRSLEFAEEVAKFMEETTHEKSIEIGKERGTPDACKYKELGFRRNVTLTSIAPTGSISLLAGCSSSIEPIFSPVIFRSDNTGQYKLSHPDAEKSYFRSAVNPEEPSKEVPWTEHVKMQAAFQKYVSSSISKTINLPNSATIEDVKEAYMLAYKLGCKGVTVYRDGCKSTQVLNTSKKVGMGSNQSKERPKEVVADIFKARADGFDWHVIVGKLEDTPYEVFAVNGKQDLPESGVVVKRKKRHYSLLDDKGEVLIDNIGAEEDEIDPQIGLETRRFSLELRHNIHPKYIVEQIDKSTKLVTSFSKAVSRIMKTKYISNDELQEISDMSCPECAKNGKNSALIPESGCSRCSDLSCSYSKCG